MSKLCFITSASQNSDLNSGDKETRVVSLPMAVLGGFIRFLLLLLKTVAGSSLSVVAIELWPRDPLRPARSTRRRRVTPARKSGKTSTMRHR